MSILAGRTGRVTAPPAEATKTLTVTHKIEDIVTGREHEHFLEVLDAALDDAIIRVQPKDRHGWLRCINLAEQRLYEELEEARRYWRNEESFWW